MVEPGPSNVGNNWAPAQLNALTKLRNYHFKLSGYYTELIEGGPGKLGKNQPHRPQKPDLDSLDKILKLETDPVDPKDPLETLQAELKEYFPNNEIAPHEINWEDIFSKSIDVLAANLSFINEGLRRKQLLADCLFFGELLEKLFCEFQHKKMMGLLHGTWGGYLKQQSLAPSSVRKYREIYHLLKSHKRFYNLCVSFDYIYKKRNLIKLLLSKPNLSDFWLV